MMGALRALYRARTAIVLPAMLVLLALAVFGRLIPDDLGAARLVAWALCLVVFGTGLVLGAFGARLAPAHAQRVVRSPVIGRWGAVNSPASNVPSHGVRGYGQAYAIDLVAEPTEGTTRPAFGGEAFRAAHAYPAFGAPVLAMIDGEVVAASGWRRDHRARSNAATIVYLMVEGMLREIGGPAWIVGNHVTIRGDDGTYALVAHLQRGSITVRRGDRVTTGQQIARCGNSGNSSEPHVHAQLMDRRSLLTAQGIPMAFSGVRVGDADPADALPANEEQMIASP